MRLHVGQVLNSTNWISGRRLRLQLICGVIVLCALLAFPIHKSHAQNSLRVDVNLVNIFLTVQKTNGEFVAGLSRDDFRVYEDGVEQKIDVFERAEQVESSMGILVDNSGSMVDVLPMTKNGILQFARTFKAFEELFVMTFGTRVGILHDVHQPIHDLEAKLKTVQARGTSVLYDALLEGMDKVGRSEHTRKALIVFTDGN